MRLVRVRFLKDHVNGIPAGAELSYHEVHAKQLIKAGIAEEISDDGPGNGKDCTTCGGENDITEATPQTGNKKATGNKKNTISSKNIE